MRNIACLLIISWLQNSSSHTGEEASAEGLPTEPGVGAHVMWQYTSVVLECGSRVGELETGGSRAVSRDPDQ